MALPRVNKISLFVSGFLALILIVHLLFPAPSQDQAKPQPVPEKPKLSAKDLRGIAVTRRNEIVLPPPPASASKPDPAPPRARPIPVSVKTRPTPPPEKSDPPAAPPLETVEITPLKPSPVDPVESVPSPRQDIQPLTPVPPKSVDKNNPEPNPKSLIPLKPTRDEPSPKLKSSQSGPPPPEPAPRAAVAQVELNPLSPAAPAPPIPEKRKVGKPREVAMTFEEAQKASLEGRTLLRLLEHGKGPAIEIAWPDSGYKRETLFRMFDRCFGVKVALMDGKQRIYFLDAVADRAGGLNMDFYSGFVRYPAGALSRVERNKVRTLQARHNLQAGARHVRVFPRRVDALLLGGLKQLVGPGYRDARSVRAGYVIRGDNLVVDNIRVDGRKIPGAISLMAARRSGCRV